MTSILTNDEIKEDERPFATSVCVMIDGPRRGLYKKKMKSLEKSGTSGDRGGGNGGDGGKGSSL